MLKKVIFFLGLVSLGFITPNKASANCDFQTGKYIEQLGSPASIKDIDIKIPKSKKYVSNYIKTLLSTQKSSRSIKPKFKKKFKSNLKVNYKFGTCVYPAQVWQNGDWLDHLDFKDGKPIRSLNVKLEKGNIANATKFKLLIPKTRNGKHEILAALVIKNLGLIAPETFEVLVNVNGISSKMLFQEDSQKELLERNLRREGPILEGDESLLWGDKQYELFGYVGGGGFENMSLSKVVNRKWFLKGKNSQFITLHALHKMQHAYLEYIKNIDNQYFINPNNKKNDNFSDFNFLMLSMRGKHGLRPHNRKYYFNSFESKFEPIYYDGDIRMHRLLYDRKIIKLLKFDPKYVFPYFKDINSPSFFSKIKGEFKERVNSFNSIDESFLKNNFEVFKKNSQFVQTNLKENNYKILEEEQLNKNRDLFLQKNTKFNLEKNIIKDFQIYEDIVYLKLEDGRNINLSINDFSKIIGRKKVKNNLYVYLPNNNKYEFKDNLISTELGDTGSFLLHPKKMKFFYEQKKPFNTLYIYQDKPTDSLIIRNGKLKDLEIKFIGAYKQILESSNSQRFNRRGLTGCLNIYNAELENVSLELNQGQCEDSLNIINSKGSIASIKVLDAYQDAIDLDFSELKINSIKVNYAGNDCLDVSGGNYNLKNANLSNCADKAISIGEKTNFKSDKVFIDKSEVGLAVKDSSIFDGINSVIKNTSICAHVFRKKQEFGGAYAKIKDLTCIGKNLIDKDSILIFN